MAPKKPAVKAKIVAKKAVVNTKPTAKAAKPVVKVAAMAAAKPAAQAMVAMHDGSSCPCPCHSPIAAKEYGKLMRGHLCTLSCQKGTWGVWLIAFAVLLAFAGTVMGLPLTTRPLALHLANHAVMALVFALLFRLAYTGCGGLIEGLKLGMLIFTPLASLTIFLSLASIPPFMPLVGMGIIPAVLMAGGMYLLMGAIIGTLSGWLLKPCCCSK